LNTFLNINKKFLIFLILIILSIFFFSLFFKNISEEIVDNNNISVDPNFDIINPSFTINSNKERISIKAKKGNFINSDLILLEKNVSFESKNFKIYSDRAIFDKKEQTAESESDSVFESNKTEINSQGFKIIDQGEIIFFNGKTSLIIEQ
jgi:Protein of unknown function (DUF1239).